MGYGDEQSRQFQADEIADDLWTEMAKAMQSNARAGALRLYASSGTTVLPGSPRLFAFIPRYPWNIPNPEYPYNFNFFGLDVRILSPECSPTGATFNYTSRPPTSASGYPQGDPARAIISLCPTGSIQFGHNDATLANVVSIAAVGGTETVRTDQASIDRFYRHSYQRHDLVCMTGDVPDMADRYLDRLVRAVYYISDCDFTIGHPRDFEFAIGAAPTNKNYMDHPPVEPSRWIKLEWGWLLADLRVTQITHSITPSGWTVTHSYEVHNPTTHAEVN